MKKIISITVLLFVVKIAFAQKEKQIVKISRDEYQLLKSQNEFQIGVNYEIENSARKFIIPQIQKQSLVLSPCDDIPIQGPNAFTPGTGSLDDVGSQIALPFNFCFYGVNYNSVGIFDNGNVQFATNSTAFSSSGFPNSIDNMIAPFWADGKLNNLVGGLYYGKILYDVTATHIVISWDSLPYYQGTVNDVSKLNSFQLILTDGIDPILPSGKNVGFIYNKMQWTTGDASSGLNGFPSPTVTPAKPATVGMNQGNGVDYLLVGRFGAPGNSYDGSLGNDDGVSWLDGKRLYFNVCPPTNSNIEPVTYDLTYCDTIKVCGNDSLRFKTKFLGPEAGQTVSVTISCPTLSGALTYSSVQNNGFSDISVLINGMTATSGYHTITYTATDNGTPSLSNTYNVTVYVDQSSVNSTSVTISSSPTIGICPGQTFSVTANISGTTPDSYSWSNGAITAATTYTLNSPSDSLLFLTVNSLGCQKTITSSVRVNPVPVASIIGNTTFCGNQGATTVLTASSTVNYAGQAPYTYSWVGSNITGSVTTQSINATQGTYSVFITNNFNCSNSTVVNVIVNIQPQFTVTPTYTSTSIGGTVNFDVNLGVATPAACGFAGSNCVSTNSFAVGTGTIANTSTSFPSTYGNYYKNARHQMLYTASELLAAGLVPGKISNISFPVNSILPVNTTSTSSSSNYIGTLPNYSIKLKCVSASTLTTTFDNTGLIEVFIGNVTPTVGINTHNFSQGYLWDGVSNIIVDVCYTRVNALASEYYTSNPVMPYTNVGANQCLYFNSDAALACGNVSGTATNNRPNVIFGNCSSAANPNDYTYAWTPTAGLSNPTIKNPTATISGSQVYTVVVTHTNTPSCPGIGTATVNALPMSNNTINKLESNVFIYPNPNNGKFEISLSGYDLSNEKLNLQISNTIGQTVYSLIISESKTNLNLHEFSSGIYFITITNARKEKVVTKIVIQN